ncbi:AbrB/MazE/SpoVT family DNA-binding domain-containing protein [Bacillus bombysepticus]|uniref:AbrB/MazE/SpoVT family DNA-binding domain-containing protein n=1 Tax=Bacillus bombysepticus TaxID=658666 RepID=UPI0020799229|nr:AbrB/MazE/SpoVT family DNA-binding domain-containing protein [Bacillus bombysepticus]USL11100.1 AbrB/MazE/SpoVT family DNA-binding domain-containing protein [Bacillus bombysepticus]
MKGTGIVRNIDELGRVVIPNEIRKIRDIQFKDLIEIFVEDDRIILQKYQASNTCVITGEVTNKNKVYPGDIILSPKGAEILLEELKTTIIRGTASENGNFVR